jgi:hypothetical protein
VGELGTQLHAQHQERVRLTDDCATHGQALALAAGQRARLALHELLDAEDSGYVLDTPVDLALLQLPETPRTRFCRRRSDTGRARSWNTTAMSRSGSGRDRGSVLALP